MKLEIRHQGRAFGRLQPIDCPVQFFALIPLQTQGATTLDIAGPPTDFKVIVENELNPVWNTFS